MHSQQGRIDLPSAVDEDRHKAAVAQNLQVADISLVYHGGAALALNDEAAFGALDRLVRVGQQMLQLRDGIGGEAPAPC